MDIKNYMNDIGQRARTASRAMAKADTATKNRALSLIAAAIRRDAGLLRAANELDLAAARASGLEPAMLDRLTLSEQAIATMIEGLQQIASLADPIGEISNMKYRPTGIQVGQMRVPLGVIGIIYEARPNVTVDAAGLCIKSGNATILRGGSEAIHCNQALAKLVKEGLAGAGLPADAVQIIETTDRAAVGELITMPQYVDVIVPRGGKGLIERLMRESKVPMIKHLDGICHVYIDDKADIEKALPVAFNAKCHRYGTCNTMETLLVARAIAPQVLPQLAALYRRQGSRIARRCRSAGDPGRLSASERGHRRRLADRISGPDTGGENRGRHGSGDRPYQHLFVQAYRSHHHRRLQPRAALPARSRFGVGDGECIDPLRRRFRIRAGRRNRHLERQAACARPGRTGRPDLVEIHRVRARRSAAITTRKHMLWIKALHIVFIASWFAGLFYLPRIFVNLAMETEPVAITRLIMMARKLYRFMTILAIPALLLGLWLWLGYGIGKGPGNALAARQAGAGACC